jgi:signal peptidase I
MNSIMQNSKNLKPIQAIFMAFFIAVIMKLFLFDFMLAEGYSMSPSIKGGSLLIVIKLSYGLKFPWSDSYLFWWSMPKEGDVVVFYTPNGEIAVKRCAEISKEAHTFLAFGDNTLTSLDSRSYGPVPISNIIGRVVGF